VRSHASLAADQQQIPTGRHSLGVICTGRFGCHSGGALIAYLRWLTPTCRCAFYLPSDLYLINSRCLFRYFNVFGIFDQFTKLLWFCLFGGVSVYGLALQ
jgi:hypothetical protein